MKKWAPPTTRDWAVERGPDGTPVAMHWINPYANFAGVWLWGETWPPMQKAPDYSVYEKHAAPYPRGTR